jgi:hypothetical protein
MTVPFTCLHTSLIFNVNENKILSWKLFSFGPIYYTWKCILLLEKNSDSDGNAGLDITTVHLGDCNSMIIYQHLYSTKCNFFLDRNL